MLNEPTSPNDNIPPEEPVDGEVPAEQGNNRTFMTVAAILGGLILLTLICVGGYLLLRNRLPAFKSNAASATKTANSALIQQLTATGQAALFTPTSPATATATKTAIPTLSKASATPVVAIGTVAPTDTGLGGPGDAATLAFLQTQLASAMTSTAAAVAGVGTPPKITPTGALASTGFFDQVGLPSMVVLTLVLLAVIFLARRLRSAPAR